MPIIDHLVQHGAAVVFANVLTQQLGVPVPAEPTLVVAGSLAAKGLLSVIRIGLASVGAAVLADVAWFVVGRRHERALARYVTRLSRSPGPGRGAIMARWGLRSLVVARFLPGASQVIVALAGARQFKLGAFLFYDFVGILVWASLPLTGGMLFHRQAEVLLHTLSDGAVWFATAAIAAAFGVSALRRSRRAQTRTR
jgi:membrane protein DedA with SNARE-associated domain